MHAGTVKYHLPRGTLSLSKVFQAIEAAKEELDIEQYSVSQFSLEQIFIALAKTQEEESGAIEGVEGSGGAAGAAAVAVEVAPAPAAEVKAQWASPQAKAAWGPPSP